MRLKTFVAILIVIFGVIATYLLVVRPSFIFKPAKTLNSFEECIGAGYLILESYPRQCKTPDGRTFIEDIGNELEKINLIQ